MGYCQGRPQDASRRPLGRLKGDRPRHSPLCGNGWADDEAPARSCAPGLLLWRRWGDSNSRGASTPTSLAGRRTRPLCDISIAFPRLCRRTHGQPTGRTPPRANRRSGALKRERRAGRQRPTMKMPRPLWIASLGGQDDRSPRHVWTMYNAHAKHALTTPFSLCIYHRRLIPLP